MDVKVNLVRVNAKFVNIVQDDDVRLAIHNAFARYLNPYVPMQTGILSQTIQITPDYVRYVQPYAHYQYEGMVYGPNFPITENGVITGFFSPPGKGSKHPTGQSIQYSTEMHPLATHHWDKAMMRDRGDDFKTEVKSILQYFLNKKKGGK